MTCEEIMKYRNEHNSFAAFLGIVTTAPKKAAERP